MPSSMLRIALSASLACLSIAQAANVDISDPALPHDFGKQPVGSNFATQYFSITNKSSGNVRIGQVRIDDGAATCAALGCPVVSTSDFVLPPGDDGCSGRTLAPMQGCSTLAGFTPKSGGSKIARLVFPTSSSTAVEEISTTLNGAGRLDTDRIFDWAEAVGASLFSPPGNSFYLSGYYVRCYRASICLGSKDGQDYLYANGTISLLGSEAGFLTQAQAAGF